MIELWEGRAGWNVGVARLVVWRRVCTRLLACGCSTSSSPCFFGLGGTAARRRVGGVDSSSESESESDALRPRLRSCLPTGWVFWRSRAKAHMSICTSLISMEVSFELLPISIGTWVLTLAIIRTVRCIRWLAPLRAFCVLLATAALTVWPLPVALALGYTASTMCFPRDPEPTCRFCFAIGNLLILSAVVMCVPNPYTEDGAHRKPVVLYRTWSPGLAGALITLLVTATPMARIHHYNRWIGNVLNYVGLLLLLSGIRRLVGGILTHQILPGVHGAFYILAFVATRNRYTHHRFSSSKTRESVEGPGVYVAIPLSFLMMLLEDGVRLETHQWVAVSLALTLVCLLQLRPARRFLGDQGLQEPDLRARYSRMLPRL